MTSNKIHKVERGGEVRPDREDKGSDASIKHDEYGIPPGASRGPDQPGQNAEEKPKNAGTKGGAKN